MNRTPDSSTSTTGVGRPQDEPGRAKQVATAASEKLDVASTKLGEGLESLGQTLREKAPPDGKLSNAVVTVADKLEDAGMYLRASDLRMMRDDLAAVIRRNPTRSLLLGAGVGFLLGRLITR
jgi:hypothetical protein